ncbi:MAG: hypothetical protein IMX04_02815 [Candidatus Carbobacillus altaicus]|nr:hypothetical protein [Candidatus Carbobacillus altaicus]
MIRDHILTTLITLITLTLITLITPTPITLITPTLITPITPTLITPNNTDPNNPNNTNPNNPNNTNPNNPNNTNPNNPNNTNPNNPNNTNPNNPNNTDPNNPNNTNPNNPNNTDPNNPNNTNPNNPNPFDLGKNIADNIKPLKEVFYDKNDDGSFKYKIISDNKYEGLDKVNKSISGKLTKKLFENTIGNGINSALKNFLGFDIEDFKKNNLIGSSVFGMIDFAKNYKDIAERSKDFLEWGKVKKILENDAVGRWAKAKKASASLVQITRDFTQKPFIKTPVDAMNKALDTASLALLHVVSKIDFVDKAIGQTVDKGIDAFRQFIHNNKYLKPINNVLAKHAPGLNLVFGAHDIYSGAQKWNSVGQYLDSNDEKSAGRATLEGLRDLSSGISSVSAALAPVPVIGEAAIVVAGVGVAVWAGTEAILLVDSLTGGAVSSGVGSAINGARNLYRRSKKWVGDSFNATKDLVGKGFNAARDLTGRAINSAMSFAGNARNFIGGLFR